MMFLVAVIFPCLAVLLCGRPILAVLLFFAQLILVGWIPAAIVALFIVNDSKADKRAKKYGNYR